MNKSKLKKALQQAQDADRETDEKLKGASRMVAASRKNVKTTKDHLKKARKVFKEARRLLRVVLKAEKACQAERRDALSTLKKLGKKQKRKEVTNAPAKKRPQKRKAPVKSRNGAQTRKLSLPATVTESTTPTFAA